MCNGVTHCRCRCQRKVNDAEAYAKAFGSFTGYKFAHSCDMESCLFDFFGNLVKSCAIHFRKCCADNARTGNADVDNAFAFADAVESACHKGVIFNSIGKNNELCRADAAFICR